MIPQQKFAYGVDLGWLSQLEDQGYCWCDQEGNEKDPLEILQSLGIDSVRMRIFVEPEPDYCWTKRDGSKCLLGYSDQKYVIEMAKRCKDKGMRLMLDFHYSDHFADPEYQDIPAAWSGHNLEQLLEDVYSYTYQTIEAFQREKIFFEWVQVGNEINNGMLLPFGDSHEYPKNLAKLLNRGYSAVKALSPDTKVITHLAEGQDNNFCRWFFDRFLHQNNGKTDLIGLSYYPYWVGSDYQQNIEAFSFNLHDLAKRYEKEVMVCEVGGHDREPENTFKYLSAVIEAAKVTAEGRGAGIFYWEPEAPADILPDKYPLGAARLIDGKKIQFTRALEAYRE